MTDRTPLYPTSDELERLRLVAAGREPADRIIRGGMVFSATTSEFLERDVVIAGRHIAAITPWGYFPAAPRTEEVDARGSHVLPTFIDTHLHIEYTMLTPGQLARLSVPLGTTTVLTDPNGAANVFGPRGMDFALSTATPLRIFQQVSPTTPASRHLERGGAIIPEEVVIQRLGMDNTVTLGESNPFDYSEEAARRFREALVSGRRITGHTAATREEALWGYLAAGVSDDHNAVTIDEVLERVRLGAMVTIMGSSLTDNTISIFSDLARIQPALGHLTFCADDKHVADLQSQGHIDHHVRQAIRAGVDPAQAYRMATWQPALYYRLDQLLGILAPSRLADLQIIRDLAEVRPEQVYVAGELVAQDGVALFADEDPLPPWLGSSVRLPDDFDASRFRVPASGATARVRAMAMYNGYFKRAFEAELEVAAGSVVSDPAQDVLKVAVVDRHHGDGATGIGFVQGFGLRSGAIAITLNCTNMNIAVVGTTDEDMAHAVRQLRDQRGGFVTVDGGRVLGAVPLPVGGMMSAAPWEETAHALRIAHAATRELGCEIDSPYIILSFVGLGAIPDYGLTELGLVETASQSIVHAVIDDRLAHGVVSEGT